MKVSVDMLTWPSLASFYGRLARYRASSSGNRVPIVLRTSSLAYYSFPKVAIPATQHVVPGQSFFSIVPSWKRVVLRWCSDVVPKS